jgi:DNA polymerase-3 subunit delta
MMKGSINDLLATKQLPKVITLFGNEDFLVFEAYRKVVNKFLIDYPDGEVEVYDVEEIKSKEEFKDILEKTLIPNFFSPKKLCVFKNIETIFPKKAKKEKLEPHELLLKKTIEKPSENAIYLFITFDETLFGLSKKVKKDSKAISMLRFPFDLLLERHCWIEFPKYYENQIRFWLEERLKENGLSFEPDAIDFLLSNTNANLWELSNEIEKAFLFFEGKNKISLEDLQKVVSGNREINIFNLSALISKRRISEAIAFVNDVLSSSRQELLLLNIMFKFFKNLLIISELSKKNTDRTNLSKAINVSPYFLNDYLIGLKNYNNNEIEKAIREIVKIDQLLKTSSKDSKYLFFVLLSTIMQKEVLPKNN